MLKYIKKYPFSLLIIAAVIYLSFFKPPSVEVISRIPHFDKVVHFCMYCGMSGILWLEFLWGQRRYHAPMWHVWVGATLCPILFSGVVELLQEYCTTYRGGDWADFAANTLGVLAASLFSFYVLRPLINSRQKTVSTENRAPQ